jgi:WD repeat-containing protein 35
MMHK